MPEHALSARLCETLDIPTTGVVGIEPVLKWMTGLMPEGMDKGEPYLNKLFKTVLGTNQSLL